MTQNKQDLISAVKEHHVRKDFAYDAKVIEKNVNKLGEYIKADYQRKDYSSPIKVEIKRGCLLYTSPSPRDRTRSRMPSSA